MKYLRTLFIQDSHYMNHVEGLRGIAGLLVIWFHISHISQLYMSPANYQILIQSPWFGFGTACSVCLDIFFLISGILISNSLMLPVARGQSITWKKFITKRFARLYPTYLFVLLCAFPFAFNTFGTVWANILQVNNHIDMGKQYLPWTWSLAVEVQFYVIIAVTLFVVRDWQTKKWLFYTLCALIFLPIVLTFISAYRDGHFYLSKETYFAGTASHIWMHDVVFTSLSQRMSPIAIGVLVSYLQCFHQVQIDRWFKQFSKQQLNIFTAFIILGIIAGIYLDPWWPVMADKQSWNTTTVWMTTMRTWFGLNLGALLLLISRADVSLIQLYNKFLSSKIWRPFGQLAFTSFLIHPLVIQVVFGLHYVHHEQFTTSELLMLSLKVYLWSYLVSALLYLKVEQPCMHYVLQKTKLLKTQMRPLPDLQANSTS